jgi:hypothetical protein
MNKTLHAESVFSPATGRERIKILLAGVDRIPQALPLSVEDTMNLIGIHFDCKRAERLPVLTMMAAFSAGKTRLGGRVLNLTGHYAADEQTGAVGDVQITILGDDKVVTSYEMKNKAVLNGDIDRALQKIAAQGKHVQNYIFYHDRACVRRCS